MRTIYSGALTSSNIDQEITICGWVHRRRDHGGVIFIDLRDREGLVQVVFDPDGGKHFQIADSVRRVEGKCLLSRAAMRPLCSHCWLGPAWCFF